MTYFCSNTNLYKHGLNNLEIKLELHNKYLIIPKYFYNISFKIYETEMKHKKGFFCDYFYKLDMSQLKIKRINTLNQLIKFIDEYINIDHNKKLTRLIDWKRFKDEYDCLEIKDKAIKEYYKKKHKTFNKDQLKDYYKLIIDNFDKEEYRWIRCCVFEEWYGDVGVFFKNVDKIKIEKINIEIEFKNKKYLFREI